jgi:DNA repair protein RadA/Sms
MRAQRLGLTESPVKLAAHTNLRDILATLDAEQPQLAIIDSIQTMWLDTVESAPGSVSQVRACAHELTAFAKRRGIAVVMVGHVTKEGAIAGPRVVEHMVDTVLYFEGDRGHQFRILRAVKNRFGPADEIGVFEMTGKGLIEVKNPSALFLAERGTPAPGSVVFAGVEGTRPILARSRPSSRPAAPARPPPPSWLGRGALANDPRRARRPRGPLLRRLDVYLNVAGASGSPSRRRPRRRHGPRLGPKPASARRARCGFGEISLSGALRPVARPIPG